MTMMMTPSVASILLCLLQTTTRTTGFRSCPVPLRVAFQHVPIPSSSVSLSLRSSSSCSFPRRRQFGDVNSHGRRNKRNRRKHPGQGGHSALAAVSNKNNQNTASTLPPETQPSSLASASSLASSSLQVYYYDEEWEIPAYQALLQIITPGVEPS